MATILKGKFKGKKAKIQHVMVYEFAFGKGELKLLYDMTRDTIEQLPRLFELTPTKSRLNNMRRAFGKALEK